MTLSSSEQSSSATTLPTSTMYGGMLESKLSITIRVFYIRFDVEPNANRRRTQIESQNGRKSNVKTDANRTQNGHESDTNRSPCKFETKSDAKRTHDYIRFASVLCPFCVRFVSVLCSICVRFGFEFTSEKCKVAK